MIRKATIWLFAAFLCLVVAPASAGFLDWRWGRHMDAGLASYKAGNYERAEKQLTTALDIAEGFGPDHPNVATSLNNLASLYFVQGRLDEALPLFEQALVVWQASLGADHPNVGKTLTNLAALHRTLGDADKAAEFDRRARVVQAMQPDPGAMALGDAAALDAALDVAMSNTPQIDAAAAREVIAAGYIEQEATGIDPVSRGAARQATTEQKTALLTEASNTLLAEEKVADLTSQGSVVEAPAEKIALLESGEGEPQAGTDTGHKIVGNSMTGFSSGGWWIEYYAPDGTIRGIWRSTRYVAKWEIEGDTFCFDYPTRGRSCLLYSFEGDDVVFTREDGKGGAREFKFLPGNPSNL